MSSTREWAADRDEEERDAKKRRPEPRATSKRPFGARRYGEGGARETEPIDCDYVTVRMGREEFSLRVKDGGLEVQSTTGGVMVKSVVHNVVVVYPCDSKHQRTTRSRR